MTTDAVPTIASEQEAIASGSTPVSLRIDEITQRRAQEKDWRKGSERAVAIYEGNKKIPDASVAFNILHANVNTEVPALYNSTPIPDFRRKYGAEVDAPDAEAIGQMMMPHLQGMDPKQAQQVVADHVQTLTQQAEAQREKQDKVVRKVGDALERSIASSFDMYPFDEVMEDTVKATVLTGRGVARVRYETDPVDVINQDGDEYPDVLGERVYSEIVVWDRYTQGPGLVWEHVPWTSFAHSLGKEEVRKLLKQYHKGDDAKVEERLNKLPFGIAISGEKGKAGARGIITTIEVEEMWDRRDRKVKFFTLEDKEDFLFVENDPLGLRDFFPCPRPLRRTRRVSSIEPMTPYDTYAPLADELNLVTRRIKTITASLKVRGIYDPSIRDMMEQLAKLEDGQYASSTTGDSAAGKNMFQLGAGVKMADLVHQFPNDDGIRMLAQLYPQREEIKQAIYEITGISDILRGASNPSETAHAQELKATYGSQRLQTGQAAVARFARDLIRLKCEIIAAKFQKQTIQDQTGIALDAEAESILRNKAMVMLRIDIETDSTIRADTARTQQQWNDFLNGTAQFAGAMGQAAATMPKLLPGLVRFYGEFVKRLKLGREAEDEIEKMIEAAEETAEQGVPGSGPSPQELEQQKQAHDQQMQAQQQAQEHAAEVHRMAIEKHQAEMEKLSAAMQNDSQKAQIDVGGKQIDQQARAEQHQQQMQALLMKMGLDRTKTEAIMVKARAELASQQNQNGHEAQVQQMDHAVALRGHEVVLAGHEADLQSQQLKAKLEEMKASATIVKTHADVQKAHMAVEAARHAAKAKHRQANGANKT